MNVMLAEGGLSAGALLALIGFVLLFGFVLWLGLKQRRDMFRWLDRKVASEGWALARDHSGIAEGRWSWYESLHSDRGVNVDRMAVNRTGGVSEAAFTLVTRRYGERLGAKRLVGTGLIARLPRSVPASFLAVPQTAGLQLFERFFSFELAPVTVSDQHLANTWSISSRSPGEAAELLHADGALRSGLIVVAEEAFGLPTGALAPGAGPSIGRRPRFPVLIVEFQGDQVTLIGGPQTVGRQPFDDLEYLAGRLVESLR
jgi:hypothetical protein